MQAGLGGSGDSSTVIVETVLQLAGPLSDYEHPDRQAAMAAAIANALNVSVGDVSLTFSEDLPPDVMLTVQVSTASYAVASIVLSDLRTLFRSATAAAELLSTGDNTTIVQSIPVQHLAKCRLAHPRGRQRRPVRLGAELWRGLQEQHLRRDTRRLDRLGICRRPA